MYEIGHIFRALVSHRLSADMMRLRTGFEIRFRKGTNEIRNCKIASGPVSKVKVKVRQSCYRPGQAQRVLRKLRFPDFVTTAQDGGKVSALRTGRLYPQEILLVLISLRV